MTDNELNEAVARKLGTWKEGIRPNFRKCEMENFVDVPDYCNDIKAAWEIVEKLNDWFFNLRSLSYMNIRTGKPIPKYEVSFATMKPKPHGSRAVSYTVPRAICEAFLKLP